MVIQIVQKDDLNPLHFSNDNSPNLGGIGVLISPDTGNLLESTANGFKVVVDPWVSRTTVPTLTDPDRGIGWVLNAGDASALTYADLTSANADVAATSVGMMQHVLANKAVETTSNGMRNPDGSIGYYSKQFFSTPATWNADIATALNYNGAVITVNFANNDTIVMPAGRYSGQRLTVRFSGPLNAEMKLDTSALTNFSGIIRDPQHKIRASAPADTGFYIYRSTESIDLISLGNGSGWVLAAFSRLSVGNVTSYREYEDGTADMWGTGTIASGALTATITLPTMITNSATTRIQLTSHQPGEFHGRLAVDTASITSTSFLVEQASTLGTNGVVGVHSFRWLWTGTKLDYSTIGGIDSF